MGEGLVDDRGDEEPAQPVAATTTADKMSTSATRQATNLRASDKVDVWADGQRLTDILLAGYALI